MNQLIQALQNKNLYSHPIKQFELIETHISWVLLTGDYAYKIKKPVNFGFLDFSTLEKRRFYCLQELRLNRRFTDDIYLEVINIGGSATEPHLNQTPAIEYALKMRQFDNDLLLNRINLSSEHIDSLATQLADFHKNTEVALLAKRYGLPQTIQQTAKANFETILPLLNDDKQKIQLEALHQWTNSHYKQLRGLMWRRREKGFIRECHGDLHLGNIVLQNQIPVFFDCIEFNPSLRWIDVINELAFILMDLHYQKKNALAYRLLNQYLAYTGDYVGLCLLTYYQVYRAMVRAKVSLLETPPLTQSYQAYIALAESLIKKPEPRLIVMRGLSGSGKSYLATQLSQSLPAIHLNSDVVRKRLAGHAPLTRTKSDLGEGIYTPKMSYKTYQNLLKTAEISLKAGFSVVVDATFLHPQSLAEQQKLAEQLNVPFKIIDIQVSVECLRQRVATRFAEANDPSEADVEVLEQQLINYKPLQVAENVLIIHNEADCNLKEIQQQILQKL